MLAMVSLSRGLLRGGTSIRLVNAARSGGFRRCLATEVRTAVDRAETQVGTTRRGMNEPGMSRCPFNVLLLDVCRYLLP